MSEGRLNIKSEIRISKSETNSKCKFSNDPNENLRTNFSLSRFGHLNFDHSDLPFDFAQGGESFDSAQDREPAERRVEPFRASDLGFRIYHYAPWPTPYAQA
jgi:hypothetical protein